MKYIYYTLSLLFFLTQVNYAQVHIDYQFKNHINQTFQGMDMSKVPDEILLDRAMEFTDVKIYNGTVTDSTDIDLKVFSN